MYLTNMSATSLIARFSSISKNISIRFFSKENAVLGRWSTIDNSDIKQALANMDCCGDNYCGTPSSYKDSINEILSSNKAKK